MHRSPLPRNLQPTEPFTLTALQTRCFHELLFHAQRGHPRQTLIAPPGFGKSFVGLTFLAHLLTQGVRQINGIHRQYKGAIIVTPAKQIFASFIRHHTLKVPAGLKVRSHSIDVDNLWAQKDVTESATKEEIQKLFSENGKGLVIMTSRMLLEHWENEFPQDLSKYHLCLDEVHHAPLPVKNGNGGEEEKSITVIGTIRNEWQKRGGTILQASATPWHTESGERIYTEDEPRSSISLSELRNTRPAFVPKNFEVHRKMLPCRASTIRELLCQDMTPQLLKAYKAVAEHWVEQEKPVTVVRPPDTKHIEALKKVFEDVGARVFDATGKDFDSEALAQEQEAARYEDRNFDVILACRRFDEGTDHRMISNVYYIGAPSSVRLIIQLFGRALRIKRRIDGYPEKWKDTASLTLFIPKGAAASSEYLEVQRQDVTLLAAYLGDSEVGGRIIPNFTDSLRESFSSGVQSDGDIEREIRKRAVDYRLFSDEFSVGEVESALDDIILNICRHEGAQEDLTEAHWRKIAIRIYKHKDIALRTRLVPAFLDRALQSNSEPMLKMARALSEKVLSIRQKASEDENFDNATHGAQLAIGDALLETIKEFEHLHENLTVNEGLVNLLSKFTSLDTEQIAKKMRRLCMENPTRGEVIRAIANYFIQHGQRPPKKGATPKLDSCDPYGLPGYRWSDIDKKWPFLGFEEKTFGEYCRMHCG